MEIITEDIPHATLDYSAITLTCVDITLSNKCKNIREVILTEKNHPLKRKPGMYLEDWNAFSMSTSYEELLKVNYAGIYLELPYKSNLNGLIFCAQYSEESEGAMITSNYHLRKAIFKDSVTSLQLCGYIHERKEPGVRLNDLNFLWFVLQVLLFHQHLLNSEEGRHNMFFGWERGSLLLVQRIGNYWHLSDDGAYPDKAFQTKDETLFFPVIKQ